MIAWRSAGLLIISPMRVPGTGGATPWLNRLNPNGSRDAGYKLRAGFEYPVSAMVVQPDGKIVAVGYQRSSNAGVQTRPKRLSAGE